MFRLLGFPVSVRPGFLLFTGLIVVLYQSRYGLWLAGAIAVLTLLHELGHAVAARSAGAEASISLDFMAGYTSFRPRQPLRASQRALISVAGPAVQIAAGVAALAAIGVNPLSLDGVTTTDAAQAIWWAGPVLGVLNLLPVLPLDGGHLTNTFLDAIFRRPMLREMAILSIVLTVGAAVVLAADGRAGFGLLVAILLLGQIQILQATSKRASSQPLEHMRRAEAAAWDGDNSLFVEPGQRLSPWWQANRSLTVGDVDGARRAILDDLNSPLLHPWSPPTTAPLERLRSIVAVLPPTLPVGNPYSSRVLADVMLAVGDFQRGGEFAAAAFAEHRTSTLATVVARAAARGGDEANAVAWLRTAADATIDEEDHWREALVMTIEHAPELAALRNSAQVADIRHHLSGR